MANPSSQFQQLTGFMHAGPQRVFHRNGQQVFESIYRSDAIIFAQDILQPSAALPRFQTQADIDDWSTNNPGILRKYTEVELTPDPASNNELYYIVDDDQIQRPVIQEQFVADPFTLQPSNGYVVQLFRGDDAPINPGQQISPSEGVWFVKPDQGFFHFQSGETPLDMGWGSIKATCYVYVGSRLLDTLPTGGNTVQRIQFINQSSVTVTVEDMPNVDVYLEQFVVNRPFQFNRYTFNSALFNQKEELAFAKSVAVAVTYLAGTKELVVDLGSPSTGYLVIVQ